MSIRRAMMNEGIEYGDLARLVKPELSIDEFRSKMGDDKDIVVVGFTVFGKEPAADLVDFVEKSYDWVLDSDLSSGETSDGNYIVFVELQRDKKAAKQIHTMLTDIMNLTNQSLKDWTFTYYKNTERYPFTVEDLTRQILSTPEEYEMSTGDALEESLNSLRAVSGIDVKPKKHDSILTSLQIAAGIK